MIEENVKSLLSRLAAGNCFGEKVTLVAATKTRTPEEINRAISAGITDIGENKAQEFRDKYDLVRGARRHFIGRLQLNKVKYLIGKTFLIHSVDRDDLAEEISARSIRAGTVSDILLEVNVGAEESKGGYPLPEAYDAFQRLSALGGIRIKGFMAMLPIGGDALLGAKCDEMRALFDCCKAQSGAVEYLSLGMSGDWELCVAHGANMIRLGTAIFGERKPYGAEPSPSV